ncbi:hypothetical protein Ancab_009562 [Ancistrocladus abbreviatus]
MTTGDEELFALCRVRKKEGEREDELDEPEELAPGGGKRFVHLRREERTQRSTKPEVKEMTAITVPGCLYLAASNSRNSHFHFQQYRNSTFSSPVISIGGFQQQYLRMKMRKKGNGSTFLPSPPTSNCKASSGFQTGLEYSSQGIGNLRIQDVGEGNVKIGLYEGKISKGPLRGTLVTFKVYPGQRAGGLEADMMAANELGAHAFLQGSSEKMCQNIQILLGGFETKTGEQWACLPK